VVTTIGIAILLVVGVVYLFLQSWRATIIPVVAIPISLLGTFTVLGLTGARSTIFRCSAWCWRWGSWSTMPSSWSRMSSATWRWA
jgi:predicted RND superfamily exporter protein